MTRVRTRFAPSPTGYLHVGGLRTALYSYLYARQNDGDFLLRIEDTDQKRYVEGAVEAIENSLKFFGLEWDEGPFFQSQRTEMYLKAADELLAKGLAYKCYCTSERLEKMREEQQAKKQAKATVQNLKIKLKGIETKLEKLLDLHLADQLSTEEYSAKKRKFLTAKIDIQDKIKDFEQKGLSWLELAREFVLSLNQAEKLRTSENYQEMKTFLKNIGSNHILQNRRLIFEPKIPYDFVAEQSEATTENLQNLRWCLGGDSNSHDLTTTTF